MWACEAAKVKQTPTHELSHVTTEPQSQFTELPVLRGLVPPHPVQVLDAHRAQESQGASDGEPKRDQKGSSRLGFFQRWDCWVDDSDSWTVVDLLDSRHLVFAPESQDNLLSNLYLTAKPALLHTQLGRLIPRPVTLVESLELILCTSQLAFAVCDAALDEEASHPRLRLARLGIELVDIVDQSVGHRGRQIGIMGVDAHSHDACLIVDADRDEPPQSF